MHSWHVVVWMWCAGSLIAVIFEPGAINDLLQHSSNSVEVEVRFGESLGKAAAAAGHRSTAQHSDQMRRRHEHEQLQQSRDCVMCQRTLDDCCSGVCLQQY